MKNRKTYEKEKMKITKEVSKVMDNIINQAFSEMDLVSVNFMKKLYDGRRNRALNGGRLRDIVVQLSLNSCGIKRLNLDHLKIIAAGEFYNMASYYQNWHLDDKKEVKTEVDKKLCHIASHFFRELAEKTILDTALKDKIKLRLLKEISESNEAIQVGQSFELNFLNIANFDKLNESNIKDFYTKRAYLFSGRFYGCSFAMGPIMAGKSEKIIELFKQVGSWFGTGAQIINDAGDFCLNMNIAKNPEKDYQDQFADLEKGTITFVVWALSQFVDIKQYAGKKLSNTEKEYLLKAMLKNRCFDSTRKITNDYRNKMIKQLDNLQKSEYVDELKMVIKTFFNANKFYVNLREEYGYNW
jgi:geranylgeranyl pyrophosphate synthase